MKNLLWILSLLIVLAGIQVGVVQTTFGDTSSTSPSAQPIVTPSLFATDNYQLPYPGILPDSPLYFLKATRDKLVSFLITDASKKAEFDLLEADKRLNASLYLYQRGKYMLVPSTVSKGENYFEEAVGKVEEAKRGGQDVNYLIEKMNESLAKHQLVIQTLSSQMPKESQSDMDGLSARVTRLQNRVDKLRPEKQ